MLSKRKLAEQPELSQILENEQLTHSKKLQLLKMQKFSENCLDVYGKAGSQSPSIGSGGSSDESNQDEKQRFLKKRKFQHFIKQQTANQPIYSDSEETYDDQAKLFEIIEHERLKKAKYNHNSIVDPPAYGDFEMNDTNGVGYASQHQMQLKKKYLGAKRKRKVLSSVGEIKQKAIRRKEGESSSD